jgi:hypothetical protein
LSEERLKLSLSFSEGPESSAKSARKAGSGRLEIELKDRLVDWLAGWLADWLAGSLAGSVDMALAVLAVF